MEGQFKTAQSDSLIDYIIEYVQNNNMKPGDRLPSEREFSEMFGVSRPAVREAARALAAMNVIEVKKQSGMFVAQPKDDDKQASRDFFKVKQIAESFDTEELYDIRKVLECECICRATKNISEEQLRKIKKMLDDVNVEDAEAFSEIDSRIHDIIYEAAGNQPLQQIMLLVKRWALARRSYTNSFLNVRRIVLYDLIDIYRALMSRDEERCRIVMSQHIDHTQKIENISANTLEEKYGELLVESTWFSSKVTKQVKKDILKDKKTVV